MPETDNELASILSDVARILGTGNKRGSAHRSASMNFASGVLCLQTHQNPAVQRCCNLRNALLCEPLTPEERQPFDPDLLRLYDHFEKEIDEDSTNFEIANNAALAYRTAMPDPISRRSIKSFIACAIHAMAIDILDYDEGAKLLHGARTAALTLNNKHTRRRSSARPHSEAESANLPAPEPAEAGRILNEISTL